MTPAQAARIVARCAVEDWNDASFVYSKNVGNAQQKASDELSTWLAGDGQVATAVSVLSFAEACDHYLDVARRCELNGGVGFARHLEVRR